VAPSDRVDLLDADLILRSCRQDGKLLRPDAPAVRTDTSIFHEAGLVEAASHSGQVWTTYSKVQGIEHSLTTTYVIAGGAPAFNLTREFVYGLATEPDCCFMAWSLDKPFAIHRLPLYVPPTNEVEFAAFGVVPCDTLFLGEAETKWVPLSQDRFSAFEHHERNDKLQQQQRQTIRVHGKPAENVYVMARRTPRADFERVSCVLGANGEATFSTLAMSCQSSKLEERNVAQEVEVLS